MFDRTGSLNLCHFCGSLKSGFYETSPKCDAQWKRPIMKILLGWQSKMIINNYCSLGKYLVCWWISWLGHNCTKTMITCFSQHLFFNYNLLTELEIASNMNLCSPLTTDQHQAASNMNLHSPSTADQHQTASNMNLHSPLSVLDEHCIASLNPHLLQSTFDIQYRSEWWMYLMGTNIA